MGAISLRREHVESLAGHMPVQPDVGESCLSRVRHMLSRELPPLRPFEVRLRHHVAGDPMAQDQTYRWEGQATDEAHAVVLAKHEAQADGWNPDGDVACRVVEVAGFLPVAHEWVDTAS